MPVSKGLDQEPGTTSQLPPRGAGQSSPRAQRRGDCSPHCCSYAPAVSSPQSSQTHLSFLKKLFLCSEPPVVHLKVLPEGSVAPVTWRLVPVQCRGLSSPRSLHPSHAGLLTFLPRSSRVSDSRPLHPCSCSLESPSPGCSQSSVCLNVPSERSSHYFMLKSTVHHSASP